MQIEPETERSATTEKHIISGAVEVLVFVKLKLEDILGTECPYRC